MLVSVLSIFTIANKVIISLLLFFRKNNSLPNKILAFVVFLPALVVLSNYLLYLKDYRFGFLMFINQIGVHCMSALIYVYSLLMMGRKLKFNFSFLLYFVSALLPITCWIIYEFTYTEADQYTFLATAYSKPDLLINIMNIAGPIQYLFYMALSLSKVRKHNKQVDMLYSENEALKIKWLNDFIGLMLLLTISLAVSYLFFKESNIELIVLPILSNIFYFFIIYQSFNNSVLFTQEQYVHFQKKFEPMQEVVSEKYQKSSMDQEDIQAYSEKLELLMKNERMYLNSDLTLPLLSEQLELSVNKLSEIINRKYNQNFFDFINQHRVVHAKKCLKDASYDHYTLEAIAEECGFGSKTAFNRAFKKVTGITPSQYKKVGVVSVQQIA